ncbi:MAG: hypothetical protein ACPG31_12600 [Planctomycetota bacterium]
MHRLIPCIALGLLASCGTEPSLTKPVLNGVELPEIGSTEALKAQQSFRTWYDALPGGLQTNLHQEHQMRLEVAMRGSRHENFQLEVDAEILTDIAAMDRMHFDWKGVISGIGEPFDDLFEGMPLEFGATILLDEDKLWMRGETFNTALAAPPGRAAEISMEGLETLYQKAHEITLRDAQAQMGELPAMLAYSEYLVSLYPESVTGIIHPTGFLRTHLPFLTCRQFEEVDGVIDAYLGLDLQEGSKLGLAFEEIDDYLKLEGTDVGMAESIQEMFSYLPELMVIHLRLDAKHGNLLLSEVSMRLDPEEFGAPPSEGVITFEFRLEGKGWQTPSMPDSLFEIDENVETIDITPFLAFLLSAMEADTAMAESDEDYSF